jgi:hypothetical protein
MEVPFRHEDNGDLEYLKNIHISICDNVLHVIISLFLLQCMYMTRLFYFIQFVLVISSDCDRGEFFV